MRQNSNQQKVIERIKREAPGEIFHIEPGIKGFLVVQQLPEESVPILYRVTVEQQVNEDDSLHWAYLGPVDRS